MKEGPSSTGFTGTQVTTSVAMIAVGHSVTRRSRAAPVPELVDPRRFEGGVMASFLLSDGIPFHYRQSARSAR